MGKKGGVLPEFCFLLFFWFANGKRSVRFHRLGLRRPRFAPQHYHLLGKWLWQITEVP